MVHFRPKRLQFKEIFGSLFNAPSMSALAHCVSADLKMSRGIARDFKEKFGNLEKLQTQGPYVGGLLFLFTGKRFVYYLVTKKVSPSVNVSVSPIHYQEFHHKPQLPDFISSLKVLRSHLLAHGVSHLAIPKLGKPLTLNLC